MQCVLQLNQGLKSEYPVGEKCQTPKMMELIEQELAKTEKKFIVAYNKKKWKVYVKEICTMLKYECSENENMTR